MDKSAYAFKFNNEIWQKRLEELQTNPDPTSCENDLAVMQVLAEQLANAGQPKQAADVIKSKTAIAGMIEAQKFRTGELLSRVAVIQIAQKIIPLLMGCIANRFDGWENVIDEMAPQILTIVEGTFNPEEEKIEYIKPVCN